MYAESTKVTKVTKVGMTHMKALFVRFVSFVDRAIRMLDRRSSVRRQTSLRIGASSL